MNSEPHDSAQRELVIIRRRAPADDEAHHGGVWKIAYADFMTAMMAFFLVMWLINAANEETRSQVASYFNPVKLIDSRTNTKGLQDLESGADGQVKHAPVTGEQKSEKEKSPPPGESKLREEALFKDPYTVLAQLAGPAEEQEHAEQHKAGSLPEEANRSGRLGGEAYLDPFDPQTWQRIAAAKADFKDAKPQPPRKLDNPLASKPELLAVATEPPKPPTVGELRKDVKPAGEIKPITATAAEPQKSQENKVAEKSEALGMPEKPDAAKQSEKPLAPSPEIARDAGDIKNEIAKALGHPAPGSAPEIEVRGTNEGVLISLADNTGFGMFAIASAEPQVQMVRYMDKIGAILKSRPGTIIISGHTDGRPFRSDTYDNWRLSSARAQMAYYMLVRGGIDEKRVERVEGHADRDLKIPSDPEAAQNRRIEILLREAKS